MRQFFQTTFLKIALAALLSTSFNLSGVASPSQDTWDLPTADIAKGSLAAYSFKSKILKNKRDIWIYTPPFYRKDNISYPLLVVFDGQAYTSQLIPGPTILDNLIDAGKIPPLVAVFISSVDQPMRNRELPCYAPFINSIVQELIPWLHQNYNITYEPSQTTIAGSSYGGLASAYAAMLHPQIFGNVLSQSGAYWWQPSGYSGPWLVKQYQDQPSLPIRFYLDAGHLEIESWGGKMSILEVNHLFHKLLTNKGYETVFYEFQGGHEYDCWKKTFAIGLIALMEK